MNIRTKIFIHSIGYKAIVAGWGRVRRRKSQLSDNDLSRNNAGSKNLRQVKVPISNCPVLEKRWKVDFSKQICAGGEEGEFKIKHGTK